MTPALPPLSVAGRTERVRTALAELDCDAMAVADLTNIRWCTGFTGSNALLVITLESATLLTDGRYATQAPDQLAGAGAVDVGVEIEKQLVPAAAGMLDGSTRIALEADVVTWAGHTRWTAAAAGELVATEGLIAELRSVKDDAELARMALAATIVDETLADLRPLVAPGTTERTLAHALEEGMRRRGAAGPAYETIVASGPNAALPHVRPSDRELADGDLVVVDAGAMVEGYRSDMTRTFVIGTADERSTEIHDLVTRAQAAGVAAVHAGVEAGEIDRVCRDVITDAGYGEAFGHGAGHGVGLDVHELPAVHSGNAAILQAGQVITVEPGIYLPGFGGVRVEDMVVVTDDGCRVLTNHPKEPACRPSPPTT